MNELSAVNTNGAKPQKIQGSGNSTPSHRPTTRVAKGPARMAARMKTSTPSNQNTTLPPEDHNLDLAVRAFVERKPNALGHAAFFLDESGLYSRAVNRPEYYLHAANRSLFARQGEAVANRVNGIKQVVIFGQGPGEIFAAQEGQVLDKMSALEEVITYEGSSVFNDEASDVVAEISKKIGRPVKHTKITDDFEKASTHYGKILCTSQEKLVICSGSTVMNIPTYLPDAFPAKELQNFLGRMHDIAGHNGYVLVTYDSYREDKVPLMLAAYSTKEANDLFLNAIDELAKRRPELAHMSRKNFEREVRWNPKSYNVEQVLRVKKPVSIVFNYKGDHEEASRYTIRQEKGEEYQIIHSFKPEVGLFEKVAEEIDLPTVFSAEDHRGFTLQLMKAKHDQASAPKAPVAKL